MLQRYEGGREQICRELSSVLSLSLSLGEVLFEEGHPAGGASAGRPRISEVEISLIFPIFSFVGVKEEESVMNDKRFVLGFISLSLSLSLSPH